MTAAWAHSKGCAACLWSTATTCSFDNSSSLSSATYCRAQHNQRKALPGARTDRSQTWLGEFLYSANVMRTEIDLNAGYRMCERTRCYGLEARARGGACIRDRKSTRLNSSHRTISYAVF